MRGVQTGDTGRQIALQAPLRTSAPPPILITMQELQRVLGIRKTRAFQIVAEGAVETVLLGGRRMAVWQSVEAYVERLRAQQKAA